MLFVIHVVSIYTEQSISFSLVFSLSSTAQSNGPIFLYQFGGNGVVAGIVRIFYNGTWGNICDHGSFGMVEANVACRQAGYAGAFWFSTTGNSRYVRMCVVQLAMCIVPPQIRISLLHDNSIYGLDTGTPAGISNVSCSFSQYLVLLQCSFSTVIPETCNDSTDVLVACGVSKRFI